VTADAFTTLKVRDGKHGRRCNQKFADGA